MKMTEGLHYCSNASTTKTKQGRIPTDSKLRMSKVVSNDNHNQNWNRLEMEIKFAIIFWRYCTNVGYDSGDIVSSKPKWWGDSPKLLIQTVTLHISPPWPSSQEFTWTIHWIRKERGLSPPQWASKSFVQRFHSHTCEVFLDLDTDKIKMCFFRHGDAGFGFYAEHKQTVLQITQHKTKMFPALPNASRGRLSVNE